MLIYIPVYRNKAVSEIFTDNGYSFSDASWYNIHISGHMLKTTGLGVKFVDNKGNRIYGDLELDDSKPMHPDADSYFIASASLIHNKINNNTKISAFLTATPSEAGQNIAWIVIDDNQHLADEILKYHANNPSDVLNIQCHSTEYQYDDGLATLSCSNNPTTLSYSSSRNQVAITDRETLNTIQNSFGQTRPGKENIMNFSNLFKDVKFGKADSRFALSFNGQVCFNGKYYDNGALNDVSGLTFDLEGFLYVLPVQKLSKGDIVLKGNEAFYFDGTDYINLATGLKGEYVPVRVFNMEFYSVVRNLAGNIFNGQGNNFLPLLLLRDGNAFNGKDDTLLMYMLMSQGGLDFSNLFGAPVEKKA